jgi:hypothetical protein
VFIYVASHPSPRHKLHPLSWEHGGVEKHHFGVGCLSAAWLPSQQQHSRWSEAATA